LLCERLAPTERAAYVLRQAFEYPYADVARILDTTEINARQLVSRAAKRIATQRPRSASAAEPHRLLHTFTAASKLGAVAELEQLLATDVRRRATG
jgi:RNA polymerase sigma-70 factor (ECF subfamily)